MPKIKQNAKRAYIMTNEEMGLAIQELESKLAFQEDNLDQLNTIVTAQAEEIRELKSLLETMVSEFRNLQEGGTIEIIDQRPPHY